MDVSGRFCDSLVPGRDFQHSFRDDDVQEKRKEFIERKAGLGRWRSASSSAVCGLQFWK
jgi:hypothetical protein